MEDIIKYSFAYRENCKEKIFSLDIDCIPYATYDVMEKNGILTKEFNLQLDKLKENQTLIEELESNKIDGYKIKINDIVEENNKLISKIETEYNNNRFFENYIEGVIAVVSNNVIRDEANNVIRDKAIIDKFLQDEFWKKKIDMRKIIIFLNYLVNIKSDKDEKKK